MQLDIDLPVTLLCGSQEETVLHSMGLCGRPLRTDEMSQLVDQKPHVTSLGKCWFAGKWAGYFSIGEE